MVPVWAGTMGSLSSTWQKESRGVRGAETRRADGQEVSVGSPLPAAPRHRAHAGSHSHSPQRGRSPGWFRASLASPPGPISDYSSHSCWFKTLICSFCSAMPRQMRSVMFSALYDVMRAALSMQHVVWFDACFLHGFPLKQPGDFKKNRLYANMPRAIFTRL